MRRCMRHVGDSPGCEPCTCTSPPASWSPAVACQTGRGSAHSWRAAAGRCPPGPAPRSQSDRGPSSWSAGSGSPADVGVVRGYTLKRVSPSCCVFCSPHMWVLHQSTPVAFIVCPKSQFTPVNHICATWPLEHVLSHLVSTQEFQKCRIIVE